MISSLKQFLFTKHILVNDETLGMDQVSVVYALRNKLNIRITEGVALAHPDMIRFAANQLGEHIPTPFYAGFPRSVRELAPDALLLDQLIHYTITYGFGDFEAAGHSVFERVLERSEFTEKDEPKEFRILTEAAAIKELEGFAKALLDSSRPLNNDMKDVVGTFMTEYCWKPTNMGSKETAVEFLVDNKDIYYTRFLALNDFIKVVDYIQWHIYGKEKLNNVRFAAQHRKLLTKVLDEMLRRTVDFRTVQTCIEKRDVWKGVLHNIHYAPKSDDAKAVISAIFSKDFRSVYSAFEQNINNYLTNKGDVALYLRSTKGNGALLRNLNYILSKCCSLEVDSVLDKIQAQNPLVLIQLQNQFRNYNENPRTFKWTRHNRVHTHRELERKCVLPKEVRDHVVTSLEDKLKASLAGKVGKVYIAPGMENVALPLNISASESGFGIMPTGSRIKLPEGKKIRAFTYWEKVNDIDLSCFGIEEDGTRTEFSWRTMWNNQSDAVTYSGDETSGYFGGSEYFDLDFDAIKQMYPKMKYMIFCNNVFSGINFNQCVCRAGWMSRDVLDSGEIYEPKTIKSAFKIDAQSMFCYLFAVDIDAREVIWLNLADSVKARVAGATEFSWLQQYFTACETMNMRKLFEYAGTVVDTPDEADLIIGDIKTDKPQIRSYEFEKAFSYLS